MVGLKRLRRPAANYLDLDQIEHLLETAWNLVDRDATDRTAFANALRVELATFTGMRTAEIHALTPRDILEDGSIHVRRGKGSKPRITYCLNGAEQSPTLAVLRQYIDDEAERFCRPIAPGGRIWRSNPPAWHHWVTYRLGPASGLQRRVPAANGNPRRPRWLIHPHALRSAFVVFCRRWPRRVGLDPVNWETICDLGGWESTETIRRHYWFADLDDVRAELLKSIPVALAPRAPRPDLSWKTAPS